MKEQLEAIRKHALEAIAATREAAELESLRVKYLGKKGELTAVLKQMGTLSAELRPVMGQMANEVRANVEKAMESQASILSQKAMEAQLKLETVDVTIPGRKIEIGHKHPMYSVLDEIKEIFINMGFEIMDGPEVEEADYNFTKLNTPDDHPAREWSDTQGRGGRHPLPHVPPDRRPGSRQGHHHGRFKGYLERRYPGNLRS